MNILLNLYTRLARVVFRRRRNALYIVLLGGPGAGKGTMATLLSQKLGLPHLNMGAIFRREIEAKTAIGLKWGPVIKSGKLCPDHVVMGLLKRELKKPEYNHGAILDGIPRTVGQSRLLKRALFIWGVKVSRALFIDVPLPDMIERLSLRRTCSNKSCGQSFHIKFKPPKVDGVCDACGSPLTQRDDDKPEVVEERMREFERTFAELRGDFESQGILSTVESTNKVSIDEVCQRILFVLEETHCIKCSLGR